MAFAGAFRSEAPATALAVLLLIGSLPAASLVHRGASDLIYERVTPYQTLQVFESDGVRTLRSDRVPQAAVRLADHESTLPYNRAAPAVLLIQSAPPAGADDRPRRRHASAATSRRTTRSSTSTTSTSTPRSPTIAKRFFFFQPGPRMRVTVADGRQFLHASTETWDLIYGDAYIGQSVPFHLATVQFLDEVKRHLNPGGAFALNLAAGLGDPFSQAMYRTVRDRFDAVYLFRVRHAFNALVVATPGRETLSSADLLQRGRELDRTLRFDPPARDPRHLARRGRSRHREHPDPDRRLRADRPADPPGTGFAAGKVGRLGYPFSPANARRAAGRSREDLHVRGPSERIHPTPHAGGAAGTAGRAEALFL